MVLEFPEPKSYLSHASPLAPAYHVFVSPSLAKALDASAPAPLYELAEAVPLVHKSSVYAIMLFELL